MRSAGWRRVLLLGIGLVATAAGQQREKETPLGLVISVVQPGPSAAKPGVPPNKPGVPPNKPGLLRRGDVLTQGVSPGDVLFAGDSLDAQDGAVTFLFCPGPSRQTLAAGTKVVLEAHKLRVQSGSLGAAQPVGGCFLPDMLRIPGSGQPDDDNQSAQDSAAPATFQQRLQSLPSDQQQALSSALTPVDLALKPHPTDPLLHLQRSSILQQFGLYPDAAEEMRAVISEWKFAGWARTLLHDLLATRSRGLKVKPAAPESGDKTYALLVGISHFSNPNVESLQFADADALEMGRLLRTPRALGVPLNNIKVLTEQQATTTTIRSAITDHLKNRGNDATVLLFIASHGTVVPDANNRKHGYIVTHNADPQDLATTSISMDEIRKFFEDQLSGVRRMVLYLDVCRAGKIGEIKPDFKATNKVLEAADSPDENFFGLLAARAGEDAKEGVVYGGGHGAFTYYLLRALNGDADLNKDGKVTASELVDYVHDQVKANTAGSQEPRDLGEAGPRIMAYSGYSNPKLEGLDLGPDRGTLQLAANTTRALDAPAQKNPGRTPGDDLTATRLKYQDSAVVLTDYASAIEAGRILPSQDNNAFKFLSALKPKLQERDYRETADQLKDALEDRGQELLLRYLAGEQPPLSAKDFLLGAQYFEAAELLAPDSTFLESRKVFCQGRMKVFAKDYAGAIDTLENSIRLDSAHGYAYNALGIAWLEQGDYDRAILAFREASRRAVAWAYPLHNMALAFFEKGDYDSAIRTYQQAMKLAPDLAYLPYNLGLAYQRINRRRDAEAMYKKALSIQDDAMTHVALGYLKFLEGNATEAEAEYQKALAIDPKLLEASHNYAVLLNSLSARRKEAFTKWRDILQDHPGYTPSRLALAKALAATGQDNEEAARQFELLVKDNQSYSAARIALASLYVELHRSGDALAQLEEVLKQAPRNPDVLEKIGDIENAAAHPAEALVAYTKAAEFAPDGKVRKRIRQKIQNAR